MPTPCVFLVFFVKQKNSSSVQSTTCLVRDFFYSRFRLFPSSSGLRFPFSCLGVPFRPACCFEPRSFSFYLSLSLSLVSLMSLVSLNVGDFLRVSFLLSVRSFGLGLLLEKLVLFSLDLLRALRSFSSYFLGGSVSSFVIFFSDFIFSSRLSLSFSNPTFKLQSFLHSNSSSWPPGALTASPTSSSTPTQAACLQWSVISMPSSSAILWRLSVSTVLQSRRLVLQCFSQLVSISVRYLRSYGTKRAATMTASRWQFTDRPYSRQYLRYSRFLRNSSTAFSLSSVALLKKQADSRMTLLSG